MRILEQFQKEVLAPLRKERDDKYAAALKIKTDGGVPLRSVRRNSWRKKGSSRSIRNPA
nr:MAG TPA: hypothetical protein [Caudoviricetes sp.]